MKIKKYNVIILISAVAACNQPKSGNPEKKPEMPVVKKDSIKKNLDGLVFDSKKDLVCGMPVSAGVKDTMQYKGKLYGFCAKECKDEFVKDPAQYITNK